jgi:hypothetical protein
MIELASTEASSLFVTRGYQLGLENSNPSVAVPDPIARTAIAATAVSIVRSFIWGLPYSTDWLLYELSGEHAQRSIGRK